MIINAVTQSGSIYRYATMTVGDKLALASIVIALIAIVPGVSALIQTQKLREKEHKEKLLNDIIHWAYRILSCNDATKLTSMEYIRDHSFGPTASLSPEPLVEWEIEFQLLNAQGQLLLKYLFTAKIEKQLMDSFKDTLNKLRFQTSFVRHGGGYSWQGLRDNKESLDISANSLIGKILDVK